ncbi:hypothetical protein JHK85_043516 [Glycine max]|nr:hypothetical protein JHK86_042890 [Glycine max]KAG4957136.1 hypothetical protein JHK85_043516 [Glycine max]
MPRAVCDKLDQTCWNFILGDTESTKKVHWVARKDLCKPKEKGEYWTAFGEAFFTSRIPPTILPIDEKKKRWSNLWSGIKFVWDDFHKGTVL